MARQWPGQGLERRPAPCLIGLSGATASGKTTLAKSLQAALGTRCLVMEQDAYYRDLAHLPPAARAATNFDHPDALDLSLLSAHLAALRSGRAIARPVYDFCTHARTATIDWVAPRPVVLVAGFLVLADARLRGHLDWGVFLEAPAPLRLTRRIARDVTERGRSALEVRARFNEDAEPMFQAFGAGGRAFAAMTLDGSAPVAALRDAVLARLGLGTA